MTDMTGVQVVQQMVAIIVAGIEDLAEGIGSGISTYAQALWFTGTGENQTMSVFAILLCVFAGLALAIGLTRLVYNLLVSFAANK